MSIAELYQYFASEKQGGMLAAGLGLLSLSLASYLWIARSPFKAMAWPLIIIGLVELGVGIGLVLRTDAQVQALETGFRINQQSTVQSEIDRMRRVNQSFRVIKGIEVALIAIGLFLVMFLPAENLTWRAVGMGLLLQAAVLLIFDLFAEHRAHACTRWLSTMS